MSLVKFDSNTFLNEVMPDVPSCTKLVAVNAIRNAAIEFCQKSAVWVETLDPIDVTAGIDVYDIDLVVYGAVIQKVVSAFYLGRELDPKLLSEVNAKRQLAAASIAANVQGVAVDYIEPAVKMYSQSNPTQIILYGNPAANGVGALVIDAVLVPTRTSLGMDSVLTNRYLDGLVAGAKARLMMMPKKPWTDASLGAYHKSEFSNAVATAEVDALTAFGRAPIRVKATKL